MGMTMTQKILAAHASLQSVEPGQLISARLDVVLGPNGKKKFYFHGKRVGVKQENGVFSRILSVGDALFIELKK